MGCVILYRVNGHEPVEYIMNGRDEMAIYPNVAAAIAYAESNKLFQSGQADYQIVELTEL